MIQLHFVYTDTITVTLSYAVAVVGLEQTFFRVSGDVGVVELCVNVSSPVIDCPIKFPFEVQLSTCDGTASAASFTAHMRPNHMFILYPSGSW